MENQRNKILIISLAYHPYVGGAEVAIKEITERIGNTTQGREGFCFDLITCNLDGRQRTQEENFNGIDKVYRIGKNQLSKYLFPWLSYKKAIELQKENNYKIVWAMMANQSGWAALKFKKKFPQVKYLLSLQEGDSKWDIWLRTFFIRPIYKNIYKRADYIQAISNFLKKRAETMGAKCQIEVIPNGIKEELIITQEDKIKNQIITASRLVKKNGIEYLIRAMAGVDGQLIILGNGKLRSSLERLKDKLNLVDKVIFKGEVANNEVYKYLSQSSVFVRPSLSEGLGNAFLEAMAVGIPVIATPVGGIPDFLNDGETGYFCEVKNHQSIAEKINYILDGKNKSKVDIVVDKARKMVMEKYNWNKISQDMGNIFKKLSD